MLFTKEELSSRLLLFECCRAVMGKTRGVIVDLSRNNLFLVPCGLINILEIAASKSMSELIGLVDEKNILYEYFKFLFDKELVFLCSNEELQYFSKMSTEYCTPYSLTNCIIDYNRRQEVNVLRLATKIRCEHLQFRVFAYGRQFINEFIKIFKTYNGVIKSIELYLPFDNDMEESELDRVLSEIKRLNFIVIHSAEFDGISNKNEKLYFTEKKMKNCLSCGVVTMGFFSMNVENFMESLHYNSCLNKKISIDIDGNIKNCPSMTESFGNIRDTTLAEALEKPGFKKYWNINKDKIHVCKDCEFRYICTDCRAYVEDPEDILSKPLKCGYNPYTGEWSEWSTNPLKQKAIDFYEMREMVDEMNAD